MKKTLLIFILVLAACRGYKSTSAPPRTAEDVKLAEAATKLEEVSVALQQRATEPLKSQMEEFVESARLFNNAAQRFGPRSLRARDAFDAVRFQSVQLDPKITSDLKDDWTKLQTEHVKEIGRQLGYRIQ
jgi:hypothetical protein